MSQGGRGGGGGGTCFGRFSQRPIRNAESAPTTSAINTAYVICLASVHSSSWERGAGFGFGFGFGSLAIGSSTVTSCGAVHTVMTSPLARAIVIGRDGSVS